MKHRGRQKISTAKLASVLLRLAVALVEEGWYYVRTIARKLVSVDILFLASALAFNGILTMVALLLLAAAGFGWFLNSSTAGVAQVNEILNAIFPPQPYASSIKQSILNFIADIVTYRRSISVFGVLVLLWTASSLFDALRTALHRVYELKRTKGLVASLIHDFGFVAVSLILFVVSNLSIWVFSFFEHLLEKIPGVTPVMVPGLDRAIPTLIVIILTGVMFYIVYRYMTDSKPPRTAAIISAFTTTVLWVISGKLFALYLANVSAIGKIYGGYAFIIVILFWIYYSCVVFIIGGIVGQAYWERRRWRENLRAKATEPSRDGTTIYR